MLIIWRGMGFLVPIIIIIMSLISQVLIDGLFGAGTFEQHNAITLIVSLGISAIIIWFVGRAFNRRAIVYGTENSFMFIRMEFWSVILIIIVVVNLVRQII
jgi:hypothetical protein